MKKKEGRRKEEEGVMGKEGGREGRGKGRREEMKEERREKLMASRRNIWKVMDR